MSRAAGGRRAAAVLCLVVALGLAGRAGAGPADSRPRPAPADPAESAAPVAQAPSPSAPGPAPVAQPPAPAFLLELERVTPESPAVRQARALVLQGRDAEALALLASLLQPPSSPAAASEPGAVEDRAHAHLVAAAVQERRGQMALALDHLRRALALVSRSVVVRLAIARTYHLSGRTSDAIGVLEEARTIQPADPTVAAWLGSLYLAAGRPSSAVRILEEASKNRASAATLYNLGLAYQQLGERTLARQAYERALAHDATLASALNNLGVLAYQEGDGEGAQAYFRRAVEADPTSFLYHANLGATLRAQGLPERALEELEKAEALTSTPPASLLVEMGLARLSLGRFEEAARAFEQVVRLAPSHPDALWGLGVARMGQDRLEEAQAWLDRAVQANPGYWRAHHALAIVAQRRADPASALEHYEQAIRRAPAVVALRTGLGELYLQLGRPAEAQAQFQVALGLAGPQPAVLYGLGRAQLMAGRAREAVVSFEGAAAAEPDARRQGLYLYAAALAYEAAGRLDDAVRTLQRAVAKDGELFEAQLRLGELLLAGGQVSEALEPLRRARALRPEDENARRALEWATASSAGP